MYFKKSTVVIGIVSIVLITVILTVTAICPFGLRNLDDFLQFTHIARLVENRYLKDPDHEKLMDGAIAGMVSELQDPYTVYFRGNRAVSYLERIEGTYCGIGVAIEKNTEDDTIRIVETFPGGPAEEAGIMPGDTILMIDGKPYYAKNMSEAQAVMKDKADTEIVVTIRRAKDGKTVEIPLVSREIEIPSVAGEMVTDRIGKITLSQFVNGSAEKFSEIYESLKQEGMQDLIIDLRNNPGGVLEEAVEIAGHFLEEGKLVVYTEDRYGKRKNYYAVGKAEQIPLVILTDRNTASASEIFIGALKDYGLAYHIGENTFGKGVIQGLFLTGREELMTLTISQYFTPKGVGIHGKGIKPDLEIPLTEENDGTLKQVAPEEDLQLQAALEYLNH